MATTGKEGAVPTAPKEQQETLPHEGGSYVLDEQTGKRTLVERTNETPKE